jgi:flagellar basal-body rod protein FlgB
MASNEIPLLSMLKSRLGYLSQQQRGIAVNVANSDTPAFVPKDLKTFSYTAPGRGIAPGGMLPMAPVHTDAAFIQGRSNTAAKTWQSQSAPDSEARLDGNQVVLEEQMMKMGQARGQYEAAITFYEKSLNLLQLALKAPGKP